MKIVISGSVFEEKSPDGVRPGAQWLRLDEVSSAETGIGTVHLGGIGNFLGDAMKISITIDTKPG